MMMSTSEATCHAKEKSWHSTLVVYNILGETGVWPSVAHTKKTLALRCRKQRRGKPVSWQAWQQTCSRHAGHAGTSSARRISGTRRGRSLRLSPAHPVGGWRRNPCSHLWNRAFHGPQWAALPPSAALIALVFMGLENVKTPKWHASNWAGEMLVSIPTTERTHTCILLELYTNH